MKVHLTLANVASGPFFRASGRSRPDRYVFGRVPGQAHLHRLTLNENEYRAAIDDLALRLQQMDSPVRVEFELEDKDRDGGDRIAELETQLAEAQQRIADMESAPPIPAAPAAPTPETPTVGKITDEQVEMLKERDAMLVLLTPFAKDEDEPIDVLRRLIDEKMKREETPALEPDPAEPEPKPEKPAKPKKKK